MSNFDPQIGIKAHECIKKSNYLCEQLTFFISNLL